MRARATTRARTALSSTGTFHTPVAQEETPASILAGILHTWLRPDARNVQVDGNGGGSVWRGNVGSGDPEQATPELRPPWLEHGIAGKPSLRGTGTQYMHCTMHTPLFAGSRPYVWAVGRATANPSDGGLRAMCGASNPDVANTTIAPATWTGSPPTDFQCSISASTLTDGTESITTAAFDFLPHLFEWGALETTTGKARVDGVAFDGTRTGALLSDLTALEIMRRSEIGNVGEAEIAELVIASSIPTAAQLTAMRSYFAARYGLTIA